MNMYVYEKIYVAYIDYPIILFQHLEGGNYSQSAAMVRMSRSILSEMSVGYAYQHRFLISLQILSGMEARGLDIDLEVSKKIMKIFLQCAKVSEEGCRHVCMYVCMYV